jgi:hypothetical protein
MTLDSWGYVAESMGKYVKFYQTLGVLRALSDLA